MALYAFDGTWNQEHQDVLEDTNVVWFRDAYQGNVFYVSGPGTRFGWIGRLFGGVAGAGGHKRVQEAMAAVERNLRSDDATIDIVGFSRGAALALHFANSLPNGLPIRFLGLFDTVPSFGVPGNTIDLGWKLGLPRTGRVFHAMALDESRFNFVLHRLDPHPRVTEVWFRGLHSDVGGGNRNIGRSSITLDWIFDCAQGAGVPLAYPKRKNNLDRIQVDAPVSHLDVNLRLRPRRPLPTDLMHPSCRAVKLAA